MIAKHLAVFLYSQISCFVGCYDVDAYVYAYVYVYVYVYAYAYAYAYV